LSAPRSLQRKIGLALDLRAPLLADPDTDAARVFNSAGDGIPGLVIEKLGHVLIAQLHEQLLRLESDVARGLCMLAAERLGATAVYRKVYPRDRTSRAAESPLHRDPQPWIGTPAEAEFVVREAGLRFLVRPYDGYSAGLFLDHRDNRDRVRARAADRHVLNAFAYTCAYSVAAGVGAAAGTVNVDVSRRFLKWGRRNLELNGQDLSRHLFICSDVLDYYRRARRQGRSFDLIILDPPTFARLEKPRRVFAVTGDLDRLVAGAVELLVPGGELLLSVNHRGTSLGRLRDAIGRAADEQRRHCEGWEFPPLPLDFRSDPNYAKSVLVRLR
jgi:23S rRNA (cytosine1962-C5)-methyltransferase